MYPLAQCGFHWPQALECHALKLHIVGVQQSGKTHVAPEVSIYACMLSVKNNMSPVTPKMQLRKKPIFSYLLPAQQNKSTPSLVFSSVLCSLHSLLYCSHLVMGFWDRRPVNRCHTYYLMLTFEGRIGTKTHHNPDP